MGVDWVIPTADAIYARCLRDAGHLLWISDPSLPDVAARSSDSNVAEELLEKSQLSMEVATLCKTLSLSRGTCWKRFERGCRSIERSKGILPFHLT